MSTEELIVLNQTFQDCVQKETERDNLKRMVKAGRDVEAEEAQKEVDSETGRVKSWRET